MIDHYNAFISYKHAPDDIKIAKMVQQELEKYHIPTNIQKKTGKKKIERIFRDKDELPITSDLSDSISFALDHSDNLIVICSPETKKSIWVEREIKFFLEKHSRNQIYTVLVSGEPYEVIPEILLHEEREVTDSNGNKTTITVELEPLSCDFRSKDKQIKHEEITRLAAAVIGCSYDELMNRRRAYEMRRNFFIAAGAFAIMAAFGGYMFYSNLQVKAALDQSLRNQSIYLANESLKRMDNEQRIDALGIALEALPSKENPDRPVTAEAIKAITHSTMAYTASRGINLAATWAYKMPNQVDEFITSKDTKYLAALDVSGNVYAWSTEDHSQVLEYRDNGYVRWIKITESNNLLISSSDGITAYSLKNGKELWRVVDDDSSFCTEPCVMKNGHYLVVFFNGDLMEIDPEEGSIVKQEKMETGDYSVMSFTEVVLSEDETKIAFLAIPELDNVAGVYNMSNKTIKFLDIEEETPTDIMWINNNSLMVASAKGMQSAQYNNTQTIGKDHTTIACYNTDFVKIWSKDFESSDVCFTHGFINLDNNEIPNLICYYKANMVRFYNSTDGSELYENNANVPFIYVYKTSDGWPYYVTEDGKFGTQSFHVSNDSLTLTKYFTDELRHVLVSGGVYASQYDSKDIIYYDVNVIDEDFQKVDFDGSFYSINDSSSLITDDYIAVLSRHESVDYITVVSAKDNEVLFQSNLEEMIDDYMDSTIAAIDDDTVYVLCEGLKSSSIISIDMSGKYKVTPIADGGKIQGDPVCSSDGHILYLTCDYEKEQITAFNYDVFSGDESSVELKKGSMGYPSYMKIDGNYGYIRFDNKDEYIVNFDKEDYEILEYDEGWLPTSTNAYFIKETNAFAVSDGNTIVFRDLDKYKELFVIECSGTTPMGISLINNEYIILYENKIVARHNIEDGKALGIVNTSFESVRNEATFNYIESDNTLIITTDYISSIIDMNSWLETGAVYYSIGYNAKNDRFYVASFTTQREMDLGYFKRYTLDELIFKAKEILDGQTLSRDIKAELGI